MTDDSQKSNLSSPRYGYDFVVSTTEASINSGLKAWLNESEQPVQYICFLADDQGNPTIQISLDDLLEKTGGINPFNIPTGTSPKDPDVQKLTGVRFNVGIKIKMGLPSGILPKSLPAVVSLGSHASNVVFRLLCSDFVIVQNTPPGWNEGRWDVWTQPSNEAWYIETTVDLVMANLDKNLDTTYLNNHPELKQQLKDRLKNLSGTAFSLQQLLFDLDSAVLQKLPSIKGLPVGSPAELVLQRSFISAYRTGAKDKGLPLVSIMAVAQEPDPSPLQMTDFERQVSRLKQNGVVIPNPTPKQQSATTLDYLCAVDNKTLPPVTSFPWNWVGENNVDSQSGAIAVNRNAIAKFIFDQTLPVSKSCSIRFDVKVTTDWLGRVIYEVWHYPGQQPQTAQITDSGPNVINFEYFHRAYSEDRWGAYYGDMAIESTYKAKVTFTGNTIVVEQYVCIYVNVNYLGSREGINAYKMTVTDTYTISVDQYGGLQMIKNGTQKSDDSEDPSKSPISNWFFGINNLVKDMKRDLSQIADTNLKEVPFSEVNNFVFPGSRVFTYKNPRFSDHQDLVSAITYVDPRRHRPDPKAWDFSINHSSELMQNYVRGQIVSPMEKFEAAQTANGLSLLFCIDTLDAFNVIMEQSGETATGWRVRNLASSILKDQFRGNNPVVSTFSVGQSAVDGRISMAMAVSSQGTDTLFLSLQNDSRDTSWTGKPTWTRIPFDPVGVQPATITVAGIFFAETTDMKQYLIVDIDRPTRRESKKNIQRYHIDPTKSGGRYWVKHDVPVDIERGIYQSCIGRKTKGYVDGIYTSGRTADMPQLVYVPIVNVWGEGPPLPIRLSLQGGALPSAIATARYDSKSNGSLLSTTDLYAIGGSTLYRFGADEQYEGAVPKTIITNDFLSRTTTLQAMTHDGVTTLWGKNGNNQVYYVSCLTSKVTDPSAWSTPVPVLERIEKLSAYVSRADGQNTIFASGGGRLVKLTQATNTLAKIWRPQEIKLEAPPSLKPLPVKSYTTTIRVSDPKANDMPSSNVKVSVKADSPTAVYINGLYYVLGPTATEIATDSMGSIMIMEATEDLHAATLSATVLGKTETKFINPMDTTFKKITNLDTNDALRNATFPAETKAGGVVGDVSRIPLVKRAVSQEDSKALAAALGQLKKVPEKLPVPMALAPRRNRGRIPRVVPATLYRTSLGDIAIAAGDLFRWLKTGVEALVNIVYDAFSDAWHFVAKIGDKIYRAILNTFDAVVGAFEWLFDTIKTAIKDLIRFVEFLFEWDDIRRTKNVLHNVTKLAIQHYAVDGLETAKAHFGKYFLEAEQNLDKWGGIENWKSLGHEASIPPKKSTVSPAKDQNSPSLLLAKHFQDNAGALVVLDNQELSLTDNMQPLFDALLGAISEKGDVLSGVYGRMQKVATDFQSNPVGENIKAVAAILANGLLSGVKVVFNALVDVLLALAKSALKLLDTRIRVPIISDILDLLEVPDITFLDLFTWVAAVGYTVVYKIVNNEPPFPDNDRIKAIISAPTWDALLKIIQEDEQSRSQALASGKEIPKSLKGMIFIASHATAGFTTFSGNFLNVFEAESPTGTNPFSIPAAISGIIAAGMQVGGDFLAPVYPVENTAVDVISKVTGGIVIMNKVFFSGPVQNKIGAKASKFTGLKLNDGRATAAIIDSILVIPGLFVTGWHFYELSKKPEGAVRSASIVGEVSNLSAYVSRVSYAVAVNDPDPNSKQIPIGIMAVSNVITGGLQTAEAFIQAYSAYSQIKEVASDGELLVNGIVQNI
ncbi:uncharacterized protein LDX57_005795 [Aspergillus melleus]|uniref:uncharacterized protein n=1 Tax=Aspergillus melleus TaxID=138277 RepID=UPI001E8E7FBE|nr:uncharacterized protein LDX57_005795 [Aspergillus melleus]KAH8428090.1 hypothetical protein LDX57_005795 [Aspergillus melleus]